jgi:hypothetical protein
MKRQRKTISQSMQSPAKPGSQSSMSFTSSLRLSPHSVHSAFHQIKAPCKGCASFFNLAAYLAALCLYVLTNCGNSFLPARLFLDRPSTMPLLQR